jgi:hypothetical protein
MKYICGLILRIEKVFQVFPFFNVFRRRVVTFMTVLRFLTFLTFFAVVLYLYLPRAITFFNVTYDFLQMIVKIVYFFKRDCGKR